MSKPSISTTFSPTTSSNAFTSDPFAAFGSAKADDKWDAFGSANGNQSNKDWATSNGFSNGFSSSNTQNGASKLPAVTPLSSSNLENTSVKCLLSSFFFVLFIHFPRPYTWEGFVTFHKLMTIYIYSFSCNGSVSSDIQLSSSQW